MADTIFQKQVLSRHIVAAVSGHAMHDGGLVLHEFAAKGCPLGISIPTGTADSEKYKTFVLQPQTLTPVPTRRDNTAPDTSASSAEVFLTTFSEQGDANQIAASLVQARSALIMTDDENKQWRSKGGAKTKLPGAEWLLVITTHQRGDGETLKRWAQYSVLFAERAMHAFAGGLVRGNGAAMLHLHLLPPLEYNCDVTLYFQEARQFRSALRDALQQRYVRQFASFGGVNAAIAGPVMTPKRTKEFFLDAVHPRSGFNEWGQAVRNRYPLPDDGYLDELAQRAMVTPETVSRVVSAMMSLGSLQLGTLAVIDRGALSYGD